ncbi:hypothetical protein HPB51_008614 [Rhipicephalus microplus]|uniref:Zn-finger transcription factor n=1 Tax=Rhipicephalus microplus TaxID=6941 RepID=A0A9J6EMN6_RHIMP|nr:hypothetical protein HPB51_008614 [Rhipicephalus microplus]
MIAQESASFRAKLASGAAGDDDDAVLATSLVAHVSRDFQDNFVRSPIVFHMWPYSNCPPIYFKRQPFYDLQATLLPATPLKSETHQERCYRCLEFQFLPVHARQIFTLLSRDTWTHSELAVQVHLRLCSNNGRDELEDSYPANLKVTVNDRACLLPAPVSVQAPGGTTVRACLPVDILRFCFLCPGVRNKISLSWQHENDREYFVGVFLVRRQSVATILRELQLKRIAPGMTQTKQLINAKERASGGDDIEVTSVHASLTCPLSKKRMSYPCRALRCKHIQCFDALSYLLSNEMRPTWMCPVCGERAAFSSLVIDRLFMWILVNAPADCDTVVIYNDGSWAPSASTRRSKVLGFRHKGGGFDPGRGCRVSMEAKRWRPRALCDVRPR